MSQRAGQRRPNLALAWLVGATAVGSFGLAAGGAAGALVATHLSGSGSTSGLPLAALAAGSAFCIVAVAGLSRRIGRRPALAAGYGIGTLGALLVVAATARSNLGLVLVGSFLLGGPNAAVFLTRYAAADLVARNRRGRALGFVLGSITVGAVGGAHLLGPMAAVAVALALPPVVGLYLLAVPAFALAGVILMRLGVRADRLPGPRRRERRVLSLILESGPLRRAGVLLAVANLAMTAVMVIVPVHLTHHGHGLHLVGGLVAIHVAGMFCPSPLGGWLADHIGGERRGHVGLVVLALTTAGWAATDATDALWSSAFLLTLGLGWNAAVVGGSALIATSTAEASDRIEVEAGVELAKEAGAGVGAPLAGVVAALFGFPLLCLLVGLVCTIGLAVLHGGARRFWNGRLTAVTAIAPRPGAAQPPPAATDDGIRAIDLATNPDCSEKPT